MSTAECAPARDRFRHEALFYAGDDEFVARTVPFIREGVHNREPVLVVVSAAKIAMLRWELGRDADGVTFGDMAEVGKNPSRIIPVWRRFEANRPPGLGARGIGEPITPSRSADELVECRRHEALLNVAFDCTYDWSLVCPYDTAALSPEVVAEALTTHPIVYDRGGSPAYDNGALPPDPLPEPPEGRAELPFRAGPLDAVHAFVRAHATRAGLSPSRVHDVDIAVHELAINTLRHASGRGVVLSWVADGFAVFEVRDDGVIADPLVGRTDPSLEQENGRGMWIVNQLCDLVQVRSSTAGTTVRVRMALR